MLPSLFADQSPMAASMSVPVWLDLLAVFVGSLAGLFSAHERHLDLVGHIGLAILCGLGGGLIRDTIMQVGDVYMLKSRWAIVVAMGTGVLGFLFPTSIIARAHIIEWVDIMSVGLFAAAGTDKALVYGLYPTSIVLMGVITGVGGGMIRDIFLGDVPKIFRPSNWYAVCAIAGSIVYYLFVVALGINKDYAAVACVLVTMLLRRISLRYNIHSSPGVDLTPTVKMTAHRVADATREAASSETDRTQQPRRKPTSRRSRRNDHV